MKPPIMGPMTGPDSSADEKATRVSLRLTVWPDVCYRSIRVG